MALVWLQRPVRAPWVHVAVFYLVPTLLLAIPVGFAAAGNPLATLVLGSALAVFSAEGRAAVIKDAVIHDEPDARRHPRSRHSMNPWFHGLRQRRARRDFRRGILAADEALYLHARKPTGV